MPPSDGEAALPSLEPSLLAALRARTGPDGFLPFDRFMEVASYGAGVGYYQRARSPFGPEGDFYTAPRVHPIFARTIAAHVAELRRALGGPEPFSLVDLGSGDGTLLSGVARALGDRGAGDGVTCVAVDGAPARRSASLEAVAPVARAVGARATSAASIAEVGPVRGVVLAHELLDAQPVRRLRWNGSAWAELGFRLDDRRLVPAEAAVASPWPPPPLPALGAEDAGLVLDVSPTAEAIVREVADHLERGRFVILDFGAEERELLSAHPRGTVAAVRDHRPLADPASAPGEVDLSAFVDFTRIRSAAASAGLSEVAYLTQAEALGAWGFPQELERAVHESRTSEEEVRVRLAAKNLLFGFGTFRVLELAPPASAEGRERPTGASPAAPS